MSATDANVVTPVRDLPLRRPIDGPAAWVGADMRGREAEWSYRLSHSEIADIETALKAVQARGHRYRRYTPRGLPAADARSGAGSSARGGAGRARLRAAARHAGRGSADRGERHRLLGHRQLFRQRPFAELKGAPARSRLRSRRQQRDQPEHPQLRDRRAAELPHRSLRRRRAAVPAAREVGRTVGDRQFDGGAQCHAERRPDLLERLYQPFPVDRRGEVPEGKAPFYDAPVFNEHAGRPFGAVFAAAYRLIAALSRGAAAYCRGYRGARHAGRIWRAIPNCGST